MTLRYDAPTNSRSELIPFIPSTASSVLDVGCGSGRFGGEIKARLPHVKLWGIEPDEAHRNAAAEKFDKVILGFFPEAASGLSAGSFDVVVFADVLEHMIDPAGALRAAKTLLTPKGRIVASIPNIRHISVTRRLVLRGEWTYTETGIMDSTHLRFFTRSSMADLFRGAGYNVVSVTGINMGPKHVIANKWSRGIFADMLYMQYVVIADLE